ncbi:NUDIX hydrolase [Litorisediminicola beolgyonensis]|uniref:NUDIX hydrolase n=2 Tax=Litorisediminicola beolgyonensis TaxID=1173614 RepID=A0ABW3ZEH7_9RHOB
MSFGQQIAAMPLRRTKSGGFEVLMVTSRDTGRWVMPKGWEMDGEKPWSAAEIEALEEAGAVGYISKKSIGQFHYGKVLDDGSVQPCVVRVFPMMVERLKSDWKERKQRKRRWFTLDSAADKVDEPDLAELLREIGRKPKKQPIIRELLRG